MTDMGVERLIYTDISRDGRLEGPNFEMTREVALSSRARVTASGGVSSLEDIKRLSELETDGVDSMIVGKALYEGRFTLKEAIKACYGLDLDKLNACEEDHPLP
jgi:phosphoribosylformimino-5-aminoimidazole carboxamide ribonucleotide (ProFAR) isomerase